MRFTGGGGGGSFPHYQGVLNSELSAGQESTVLTNGKRPNLPTILRVCGFQILLPRHYDYCQKNSSENFRTNAKRNLESSNECTVFPDTAG